jgi:hypothetical protein
MTVRVTLPIVRWRRGSVTKVSKFTRKWPKGLKGQVRPSKWNVLAIGRIRTAICPFATLLIPVVNVFSAKMNDPLMFLGAKFVKSTCMSGFFKKATCKKVKKYRAWYALDISVHVYTQCYLIFFGRKKAHWATNRRRSWPWCQAGLGGYLSR